MNTVVLATVSVVTALFVGVTLGLLVAPDPTGMAPILVGLVLTAVLAPALYVGLGQLVDSDGRGA